MNCKLVPHTAVNLKHRLCKLLWPNHSLHYIWIQPQSRELLFLAYSLDNEMRQHYRFAVVKLQIISWLLNIFPLLLFVRLTLSSASALLDHLTSFKSLKSLRLCGKMVILRIHFVQKPTQWASKGESMKKKTKNTYSIYHKQQTKQINVCIHQCRSMHVCTHKQCVSSGVTELAAGDWCSCLCKDYENSAVSYYNQHLCLLCQVPPHSPHRFTQNSNSTVNVNDLLNKLLNPGISSLRL